jgi:hypothetical protein
MECDTSSPADATAAKKPRSCRRPTILELLICGAIAVVLIALLVPAWRRPQQSHQTWTPQRSAAEGSVGLAIDFGNGVRREFLGVPWKQGMTAGDLLRRAREMRPGLSYEVRGSGEMTFLDSLDGVSSGDGDGRYWFYEVDGRLGEVSFEVQPLEAGNRVLWVFKRPE